VPCPATHALQSNFQEKAHPKYAVYATLARQRGRFEKDVRPASSLVWQVAVGQWWGRSWQCKQHSGAQLSRRAML
jgi:hypothetical protein